MAQISSSAGTTYYGAAQVNALDLPTLYALGLDGNGLAAVNVTQQYWGPDGTSYPDAVPCPYGSLKQILAQTSAGTVLDLSYAEQPNGNIRRITDAVVPETLDYSYDFLDRLLSVTGGYGESVSFGALSSTGGQIGNIQSATLGGVTTNYVYGDSAQNHAATTTPAGTLTYDANGNAVSRGSQTLTYNWDNRLVRVVAAGVGLAFTYDGDGRRARKVDQAGAPTLYLGRLWERNHSTAQETQYVYAAGRLVAFKQAGTVHYVLADHLGSTMLQLSASGAVEKRMRYSAFGQARDSAAGLLTDRRFTGQRLDTAVDLYDYGAREYDQTSARFTQPDSASPGIGTPQSLNRYSYVLNNPLRYVDPTGNWVAPWWNPSQFYAHLSPAQPSSGMDDPISAGIASGYDPLSVLMLSSWEDRLSWLRGFNARTSGWFRNLPPENWSGLCESPPAQYGEEGACGGVDSARSGSSGS